MSPLREQLLTARREYEAARYPGDLPAHLPPEHRLRTANLPGIGAVAAAIVVGLMLARPAAVPVPTRQVASRPPTNVTVPQPNVRLALPSIPPMHGVTASFVTAPPVQSISAPRELRLPRFSGIHSPAFPSKPEAT